MPNQYSEGVCLLDATVVNPCHQVTIPQPCDFFHAFEFWVKNGRDSVPGWSTGQDFFFWFHGEFWQAGSKNEAIAGLGLSKKEVADHFKGMKQNFKHDPEAYLKELLRVREEKPEPFQSFPSR